MTVMLFLCGCEEDLPRYPVEHEAVVCRSEIQNGTATCCDYGEGARICGIGSICDVYTECDAKSECAGHTPDHRCHPLCKNGRCDDPNATCVPLMQRQGDSGQIYYVCL